MGLPSPSALLRLVPLFLLSISAQTLVLPAAAQEEEAEGRELAVERWLLVAPTPLALPVFADEGENKVELADLLAQPALPAGEIWPAGGQTVDGWGDAARWEETSGAHLRLSAPGSGPAQALAAFYLTVDDYTPASLELRSEHLLELLVDGKVVKDKKEADAVEDETAEGDADEDPVAGVQETSADEAADVPAEPGSISADLELIRGKHLVIVRMLRDPAGPADWTLGATLKLAAEDEAVAVKLDLTPKRNLRLADLLDSRSMGSLDLSPDGKYLSYQLSDPGVPSEGRETWREIVSTKDGELVRSFRGEGGPSSFEWVPGVDHLRYSFVTREDGKASLWVADLKGMTTVAVLEGVENFGGYQWMPDGGGLIYSVSVDAEKKHDDFKRYQHLADRWGGFRDKSYLYHVGFPGGVVTRLTAGAESTNLLDIAPDGSRLLFGRTLYDKEGRPFYEEEIYELDLSTLEARRIVESRWVGGADYMPDGTQIVLGGGPSAFGEIGINLPEGMIPNDYDNQLYLMDLKSLEVQSLTRDFDPSISGFHPSAKDGAVYFSATDQERVKLYRYDPKKKSIDDLASPADIVGNLVLSRDGSTMAYVANGTNEPRRIYAQDAKKGSKPRLVADPNGARFEQVQFGDLQDFDFEASDGTTIVGRVYYPPEFDATRADKWPAIVYYYGGTSPVTRDFGGRYPKEYWASSGFVVYVLQPSGATGFGQEFSARHVNDWGKRAGQDIIEGTHAFLEAHGFVDPARVGCIGASYGGFMTMYIISQTDLFAGAVSHAGISFLGSYWGEGDWGAYYSAVATADKYPWNDPEFYWQQGGLFNADKINTPILLLHGGIDNNVPPGESEQLYTALKILGKEVEFLRIDGERHFILTYPKRELWAQSIVAFFDRTLKGDRRTWNHLWEEDED